MRKRTRVSMFGSQTKMREARLKKNLTLRDMDRMVGTGEGAMCRYENGVNLPRVDIAIAIAKVLGTTVESIFDGVEMVQYEQYF